MTSSVGSRWGLTELQFRCVSPMGIYAIRIVFYGFYVIWFLWLLSPSSLNDPSQWVLIDINEYLLSDNEPIIQYVVICFCHNNHVKLDLLSHFTNKRTNSYTSPTPPISLIQLIFKSRSCLGECFLSTIQTILALAFLSPSPGRLSVGNIALPHL